jgi:hypothetical protein
VGRTVEQSKESHGQATAGGVDLASLSARVAGFASLGRQIQSHPSPRSVVVTGRLVSYIRQGRGSHA